MSAPDLRMDKASLPVILSAMPRPKNEREAWEHELREELPAQLAAYQQELAAGQGDKTRRGGLEWHIRRGQEQEAGVWGRVGKGREGEGGRTTSSRKDRSVSHCVTSLI